MVSIFWEIILSFAGVIVGFFVAEFVLEKIGLGIQPQKTKVNVNELPEYLNQKFLVNCAILIGEKKKFSNLEDQEIAEMKKMVEEMNCNEIAILKEENCKLAIKKGKILVCVRGKVISMKDLSEISEVIHRSLGGVGE
ncbi:MAG: hypothetical protein QXV61_03020 [Archaeoglobaceae archaeon]